MRNTILVLYRDLKIFFSSAGSYLIIFFFLIASSLWFYKLNNFLIINLADFRSYFAVFPYLMAIIIPALSMGILAGQRQNGSFELLTTLPVKIDEIIAGKYIALMFEAGVLLILTLPVPFSLTNLGNFDRGQIVTQYIGIYLISSLFISVSLFVSAFSRTQTEAYIVSVMLFFLLILPGLLFRLSPVLSYISPSYHYRTFFKGVLDSRDLVYFLVVSLFFLFLTVKKLKIGRFL